MKSAWLLTNMHQYKKNVSEYGFIELRNEDDDTVKICIKDGSFHYVPGHRGKGIDGNIFPLLQQDFNVNERRERLQACSAGGKCEDCPAEMVEECFGVQKENNI